MRRIFIFPVLMILLSTPALKGQNYQAFFTDSTMRVDYYHTGTAAEELFSLDQVYLEGPWPGSKTRLLDSLHLGKYLAKVYDVQTDQLLFSFSYNTVFGEWQTTSEALSGIKRTMHESVRFPFPRRAVKVVIASRDRRNVFSDQFTTVIEPNSRFVNREIKHFPFTVQKVSHNGDPARKVDLLILGDGYTQAEAEAFNDDVARFQKRLFSVSPFKERKEDFNVWAIQAVAPESGIDDPRAGVWKNNLLGTTYNSLDLQRYVLTTENRMLRDVASMAPYDALYIIFNAPGYGGGGIYNWYSTCYAGESKDIPEWWSLYVFVHEFGHSFGGLGDEYYSSDVAYNEFYPAGVEPVDPNLTALLDKDNLKWKHLVQPGTPLPTPWGKALYDSLSLQLRLSAADYFKNAARMDSIRTAIPLSRVGAYEGAGYASNGLYRPAIDCIMFSKNIVPFCPVCVEAINRVIDTFVK